MDLQVRNLVEGGFKVVEVPAEGSLALLYEKVAEVFEMSIEMIELVCDGEVLKCDDCSCIAGTGLRVDVEVGLRPSVKGLALRALQTQGLQASNCELMCAVNDGLVDLVLLCLDAGVDVNAGSFLHTAARRKNVEISRHLIERGADVDYFDGTTPLHEAVCAGALHVMELLLDNGAAVDSRTKSQLTPLHACLLYQNALSPIKLLLARGAAVNVRDRTGNTPLSDAVARGWDDAAEILVSRGADVNAHSKLGTTLHISIIADRSKLVPFLLEKGADPNLRDANGGSALHAAVRENKLIHVKGKLVVQLLLENGASTEVFTKSLHTPFHLAVMYGNAWFVELLVESGAKVHVSDEELYTPLHDVARRSLPPQFVSLLLEKGGELNAVNKRRQTPLHVALCLGRWDIGKRMLELGADAHASDEDGNRPLHCAAKAGLVEAVTVLLEKGADINAVNGELKTPLHVAVCLDREKVALLLILKGAAVNTTDSLGRTPAQDVEVTLKWTLEEGKMLEVRKVLSVKGRERGGQGN